MRKRFDPLTVAALAVAVVSISTTAPLTAAASASPLAMAFWRTALGFATLGPFLLILRRREVVRVARGERDLVRREQWRPLAYGFLAATALALHFAAFMTSTRMTTVAMSTALVATQPVWQALIAAAQGVRASRITWAGLILAVVGAAAAAGLDVKSGGPALTGDLLALGGAVAQAGYTALSQKARADVSTPLYSTFSALVCGLELFVICWIADIPLTGFDTSTQLSLLGLLLLPQLLGLGSMNFALGRASATTVSVLLLLETPVAALLAWWLMGQSVALASVPGMLLIIIGTTIVVTKGEADQEEPRQEQHPARVPPPPGPAPSPSPHLVPAGRYDDTPTLSFVATWLTSPKPQLIGPEARRDPRAAWAGLVDEIDSPTVSLSPPSFPPAPAAGHRITGPDDHPTRSGGPAGPRHPAP